MSATSPHVFFLSGEPFTVQAPAAKARSCSLASSRCAAIFRPLSLILSRHLTMALPPTHAERLPYVPIPNGICAVSPWTISTCSIGMPSSSATSWRSEEHTSELQSLAYLVCRLLLEKKKKKKKKTKYSKKINEHTID